MESVSVSIHRQIIDERQLIGNLPPYAALIRAKVASDSAERDPPPVFA